jgi:hypothetical protein
LTERMRRGNQPTLRYRKRPNYDIDGLKGAGVWASLTNFSGRVGGTGSLRGSVLVKAWR